MKTNRKHIWRDVLKLLKNNGHKTYRAKEIAKQLGYKNNKLYRAFRDVLSEMERNGIVTRVKGGRYTFRKNRKKQRPMQAEGILRVNPKGFGFVTMDDQREDLFVPPFKQGTALDGDRVRVGLSARSRHDRKREAEVLEVLERRRTQTVGTFTKSGHFAFVRPDDQNLTHDVYVPRASFNGAKNGDKVLVSIDQFDDPKAAPEGRVLDVLGAANDPGIAVLSIAMSKDFKAGFPKEVIEAAAALSAEIIASEISRRLDLRTKRTFTIDPDDAKDFDDAIHIERLENGNFEVGVHIADVSHYVRPGTPLDAEAYQRATSVYLVDRVIPMLPEKLSNEACSLRPHEDKLTYSCLMEVSPTGVVQHYDIRETVIHSHQRFTYAEAQALIENPEAEHELAADVRMAQELAKVLTTLRFGSGSVDFDKPEVQVILEASGTPIRIQRRPRQAANRLIEEFMLLANRTVAAHLGKNRRADRPFVYRIHDLPNAEQINTLAEYVKVFGHELPLTDGNVKPEDLNALLASVRGLPEEPIIQEAALRSMSKAIYSVDNIGHFGLGFKHYTHFTSPIRRYPDLIVHRLLKAYGANKALSVGNLAKQCEHCSFRERAAEEAERESVKLKQVEYMQQHVGETFSGVVSGVTRFGVFVELDDILVEGLVHVRDMDDYYSYEEHRYALVGESTGRTIRLGNAVTVQVTAANPDTRQIDFVFIE